MLRFLFPRLTAAEPRGAALFRLAVNETRQAVWFTDLKVPDTVDGRFSVLATVTALLSVRLEQGGEEARNATVALTERFIEAMDAEHRQLGLGDPTLGKTVRKLVGSLARRIALWRSATADQGDWVAAAQDSVDGDGGALVSDRLRDMWAGLQRTSDPDLIAGRLS